MGIKLKLTNLFTLFIFSAVAMGQSVYWEPEIPVPGGDLTIYYNVIEGTLDDNTNPVYIHIGHSGWIGCENNQICDYAMTYEPGLDNGWWSYVYEIAEVLEISTGRVSQIKKSIIGKLRNEINPD